MTSLSGSTAPAADFNRHLSLYIHIPFCVKKCRYCDFASVVDSVVTPADYVAMVVREMELRAGELALSAAAGTLYIGGGTPSLLAPGLVEDLIIGARQFFHLEADAEITLEANPGSVSMQKLAGYRDAGVNRLSLGVQSLDNRLLELLGRAHTAEQATEAFAQARVAGFDNIGIDLIHSIPGQSLAHWEQTLHAAIMLSPDHISAYGLSIEEGTPFASMVDSGELSLPDDDLTAGMYEATMKILPAVGYEHYEIANFALSGMRSRHNQVYWHRGDYLGFGAAAHSFLRKPLYGRRWYNPSDIEDYCRRVLTGTAPADGELLLSLEEAEGEFLFLGLRMLEGVSIDAFCAEFGEAVKEAFSGAVARHLAYGLIEECNGRIRLTERGLSLANQVFSDFV